LAPFIGGKLEPAYLPDYSIGFRAAVRWLIDEAEGGGKLIHDGGGATRWGISKRGNPDIDVEVLTREGAVRVYHERYWTPIRGDELPFDVAIVVFDFYVQNQIEAVREWQKVVRVKADGVMGPDTIAASQMQTREKVRRHLALRHVWYENLARRVPAKAPNLEGWHFRLVKLACAIGECQS
jgi:lysozyme family protein